MGLATIHLAGTSYILLAHAAKWPGFERLVIPETLTTYSLTPLPGQLALVCAVTVLAAFLRRLMLY
jgi:biotin transport system substrate-specific component